MYLFSARPFSCHRSLPALWGLILEMAEMNKSQVKWVGSGCDSLSSIQLLIFVPAPEESLWRWSEGTPGSASRGENVDIIIRLVDAFFMCGKRRHLRDSQGCQRTEVSWNSNVEIFRMRWDCMVVLAPAAGPSQLAATFDWVYHQPMLSVCQAF